MTDTQNALVNGNEIADLLDENDGLFLPVVGKALAEADFPTELAPYAMSLVGLAVRSFAAVYGDCHSCASAVDSFLKSDYFSFLSHRITPRMSVDTGLAQDACGDLLLLIFSVAWWLFAGIKEEVI